MNWDEMVIVFTDDGYELQVAEALADHIWDTSLADAEFHQLRILLEIPFIT